MWVRIAAHYAIWHEPTALAFYRMHDESNTGRHLRSAEDLAYTRKAIDMFAAYLPPDARNRVVGEAKHTYALSCLDRAKVLGRDGHFEAMRAHLREATRFDHSVRTMIRAASVYLRGGAWRS